MVVFEVVVAAVEAGQHQSDLAGPEANVIGGSGALKQRKVCYIITGSTKTKIPTYDHGSDDFLDSVQRPHVEPADRVSDLLHELGDLARLILRQNLVFQILRSPGSFFIGHSDQALAVTDHAAPDWERAHSTS